MAHTEREPEFIAGFNITAVHVYWQLWLAQHNPLSDLVGDVASSHYC